MSQWSNWEADEMMKEAEPHWEDPDVEPSFDREIEEKLAEELRKDVKWQLQQWLADVSGRNAWSTWEVL